MNTDLNLSELFDRYLENDLNIHEMQEFELRLKNDQAFSDSFRLHKEVDNALIEEDIMNFRLQLEKISVRNSDLLQAAPMIITEEIAPEIDKAIMEQDIIALRDQLNRIHNTITEEVRTVEVKPSKYETVVAEKEQANQDPRMTALLQDIDVAIMQDEVMALRSRLEIIGERTLASKKVNTSRRRMITYASSAVAAIFILAIAGAIFLNQNSSATLSNERTFSRYYEGYDGISNKRGPAEEGKSIIELGIQKYNKGDYANALELFDAYLTDNNSSEIVRLYAGTAALFTGDPDKALRYFENWEKDSPYDYEIDWYTAGCYLKKNNLEKAKTILSRIASTPGHDYGKKATDLLKTLN